MNTTAAGFFWILSIFGADFQQEMYMTSYDQCKEAASHYVRHYEVTGVACLRVRR